MSTFAVSNAAYQLFAKPSPTGPVEDGYWTDFASNYVGGGTPQNNGITVTASTSFTEVDFPGDPNTAFPTAPSAVTPDQGQASVMDVIVSADQQTVSFTLDSAWNTIKNAEVTGFSGTNLTITKFVDAFVTSAVNGAQTIRFDGSKRGGVTLTGTGDKTVDIGADNNNGTSGSAIYSVFTLSLAGGNNVVTLGDATQHYAGASSGDNTAGAYSAAKEVVSVTAGNGNNRITTAAGSIQASLGDGANYISSGSGAVTFKLGNGANTVMAGSGDTTGTFGNGANTFTGSSGTATLTFGSGNNTVTGGTGATSVTFGSGQNSFTNSGGTDTLVLAGPRYQYMVAAVSGGETVTNLTNGGVTTISGVQTLKFNDQTDTAAQALTDNPCFARGTRIATERGDVAVEDIVPGDRVMGLLAGGWVDVVWVGSRRVDVRRHSRPSAVAPIRVAACAFGPGVPRADVVLSPEHAVYLEGVLVPVRHLVNGSTVRQFSAGTIDYFHVETARHDVLDVQGLPAESFLDTGNRGAFAGEVASLVRDDRAAASAWADKACAPLVTGGPMLDKLKAKIARWADAAAALEQSA